jgi:hypothetical protein
MIMSPQEKAFQIENEKLKLQNEKMRRLATRQGFFIEYFRECKNQKTNKEAFEVINQEYHSLFGQWRYSDHDSFKKAISYQHSKKSKK